MKSIFILIIGIALSSCVSVPAQRVEVMPGYPKPGTLAVNKLFSTFPTIPE
jgi:hypothetical protein